MKVTVKVKPRAGKTPASIVRDRLAKAHAAGEVEEVFPGAQEGRRAGLVIVNLPDDLSAEESAQVLQQLRNDDNIDYAELVVPRRKS